MKLDQLRRHLRLRRHQRKALDEPRPKTEKCTCSQDWWNGSALAVHAGDLHRRKGMHHKKPCAFFEVGYECTCDVDSTFGSGANIATHNEDCFRKRVTFHWVMIQVLS